MDPEGYEKQMKQLLEAYEKAEKAAAERAQKEEDNAGEAEAGNSNAAKDAAGADSKLPARDAAEGSASAGIYKYSESEDGLYHVKVVNKAGEPVQGARIQFCSDTFCMMGKTDADGIASWEMEAGTYEIHVNKVPQGYADVEDVIPAPEEPGTVVITLSKEKQ